MCATRQRESNEKCYLRASHWKVERSVFCIVNNLATYLSPCGIISDPFLKSYCCKCPNFMEIHSWSFAFRDNSKHKILFCGDWENIITSICSVNQFHMLLRGMRDKKGLIFGFLICVRSSFGKFCLQGQGQSKANNAMWQTLCVKMTAWHDILEHFGCLECTMQFFLFLFRLITDGISYYVGDNMI